MAPHRRDEDGAPARAPLLETGPRCYLCLKRNMVRVGPRVYYCQRCERGTLLTLHASGWQEYGVGLKTDELLRLQERLNT